MDHIPIKMAKTCQFAPVDPGRWPFSALDSAFHFRIKVLLVATCLSQRLIWLIWFFISDCIWNWLIYGWKLVGKRRKSGWWCHNHLEKYERQWLEDYPIYEMENKIHVWNHHAEIEETDLVGLSCWHILKLRLYLICIIKNVVLWWIGDGFLDASGSSHSVYLTSRHWTVGIRFEPGNAPCIPIPHLCGHIQATGVSYYLQGLAVWPASTYLYKWHYRNT